MVISNSVPDVKWIQKKGNMYNKCVNEGSGKGLGIQNNNKLLLLKILPLGYCFTHVLNSNSPFLEPSITHTCVVHFFVFIFIHITSGIPVVIYIF